MDQEVQQVPMPVMPKKGLYIVIGIIVLKDGAVVMFLTSDSMDKVSEFYKKELASNGWTVEQTANMGPTTIIAGKKDSRTFSLSIIDTGEGNVSVVIGIFIPKTD